MDISMLYVIILRDENTNAIGKSPQITYLLYWSYALLTSIKNVIQALLEDTSVIK